MPQDRDLDAFRRFYADGGYVDRPKKRDRLADLELAYNSQYYAGGGQVAHKLNKSSVDYSMGMGKTRCRNCAHFQKPSGCALVAGKIDPGYWCQKFTAAYADGGMIYDNNSYDNDPSVNVEDRRTEPNNMDWMRLRAQPYTQGYNYPRVQGVGDFVPSDQEIINAVRSDENMATRRAFANSLLNPDTLDAQADRKSAQFFPYKRDFYDSLREHQYKYADGGDVHLPNLPSKGVPQSGPMHYGSDEEGFADGGTIGEVWPEWLNYLRSKDALPYAEGGSVFHSHMPEADAALHMTPQEKSLYERHLMNLLTNGGVDNPDGTRSTLYQMSAGAGDKFYNVPTVYEGRILPPDEAWQRALDQGLDTFPSYPTQDEAEDRYRSMHNFIEQDRRPYAEGGKVDDEQKRRWLLYAGFLNDET